MNLVIENNTMIQPVEVRKQSGHYTVKAAKTVLFSDSVLYIYLVMSNEFVGDLPDSCTIISGCDIYDHENQDHSGIQL